MASNICQNSTLLFYVEHFEFYIQVCILHSVKFVFRSIFAILCIYVCNLTLYILFKFAFFQPQSNTEVVSQAQVWQQFYENVRQ